jgi:hypothetical protein
MHSKMIVWPKKGSHRKAERLRLCLLARNKSRKAITQPGGGETLPEGVREMSEEDRGLTSRIGPFEIDWPRTPGSYGGIG